MEYTGLYIKYPINRALTEQEREQQLKQKERLEIEPAYQLSVIKLNSTYMEMVDKYFSWKGFVSCTFIVCICLFGGGWLAMLVSYMTGGDMSRLGGNEFVLAFVVMGAIAVPAVSASVWLLCKESFAYTHYPIRFNRKTRMVHVFRLDGTVLSVPWDEVFFCLGSLRQGYWEIQGHVLGDDGVTVQETFSAFPDVGGSRAEGVLLKQCWEFVRRYMEVGPESIFEPVKVCLPIEKERESSGFGFHRMNGLANTMFVVRVMVLVLYVVILPGRWFAMKTSKIPHWSAEIEAVNQVEADDRFVRDATMNPKWREMPDAVWLGISVVLWAVMIYWVSGLEPWR